MNVTNWGEALRASAIKNRRSFTWINFALSAILVILSVTVGLAIEELVNAKFDFIFWITFALSSLLLVTLWIIWKIREAMTSELSALIHISIDQVGVRGWGHEILPKDVVTKFAPISQQYRVLPGCSQVNIGSQLGSVVGNLERLVFSMHGTSLSVIPVGHFPAMFGLGYRFQFPPGTNFLEQVKKSSAGSKEEKNKRANSEFISCNMDDIWERTPVSEEFSKSLSQELEKIDFTNVDRVWCEFAFVDDPKIVSWREDMASGGPAGRRSSDLIVSVGFFDIRSNDKISFSPVEIVNRGSNGECRIFSPRSLSVAEAACCIVETVNSLLLISSGTQIDVLVRAPRIVSVVAGILFQNRVPTVSGGFPPMDPWDRLTLWGPEYRTNDEGRDGIISTKAFKILDDL